MILSMTAFGRTQTETSGYAITVEVRTLNSRYLDIILRLPKSYNELEDALRKQVSQNMRRGRIEVFVQIEAAVTELKVPRLNPRLARVYWEQLQELHRQLPGSDPPKFEDLLRIPYIFESPESAADAELLKPALTRAFSEVLLQVQTMRKLEGEALMRDGLARLEAIRDDLAVIEDRKDLIIGEYQKRLSDRIQELLGSIPLDENRLLQEVACFAERSDINEEVARLHSHLDQVESLLTGTAPADGRRLDFLTQELHRETNTIGCKTGDLEVVQAVVRMKSEIGKLKEQVQNVE